MCLYVWLLDTGAGGGCFVFFGFFLIMCLLDMIYLLKTIVLLTVDAKSLLEHFLGACNKYIQH